MLLSLPCVCVCVCVCVYLCLEALEVIWSHCVVGEEVALLLYDRRCREIFSFTCLSSTIHHPSLSRTPLILLLPLTLSETFKTFSHHNVCTYSQTLSTVCSVSWKKQTELSVSLRFTACKWVTRRACACVVILIVFLWVIIRRHSVKATRLLR